MEEFSHFQLFDEAHLITLTFIVLLSILSAFFGFWIREVKAQKFISWSFVLIFIVSEVYSNFTALQSGHWRYTWALPLQLCDLSLLALMVALLWKNQTAWELAYYWGIGGSIPAMITPDLPMAFPHFFYLTFFFQHAGVVMGVLYLTFSGKYYLPFSSIKRVWIISHLYLVFIAIFNALMNTNYLFLCYKPTQPSLLDYLGPWPFYIIGLEVLFTLSLFLLYWIFPKSKNISNSC